jgi:hypothetical protein
LLKGSVEAYQTSLRVNLIITSMVGTSCTYIFSWLVFCLGSFSLLAVGVVADMSMRGVVFITSTRWLSTSKL